MAAADADLADVGLLGDMPGPRRTSTIALPKFMKIWRAPAYGGKTDFVEIRGFEPIEGVSADWSKQFLCKSGLLCQPSPVHFDSTNPSGTAPWGPAARGAIVVAIRGFASFDVIGNNAADSGAVGLIIVDNEPKTKNNWTMTKDKGANPPLPAVLVAKKHAEFFCSGCGGENATIIRRPSKLGTTKIATNIAKAAAWPF